MGKPNPNMKAKVVRGLAFIAMAFEFAVNYETNKFTGEEIIRLTRMHTENGQWISRSHGAIIVQADGQWSAAFHGIMIDENKRLFSALQNVTPTLQWCE